MSDISTTIFMDIIVTHLVITSLLNTPHPLGKLARWGLALQEVDLVIHYRPGKSNVNLVLIVYLDSA